MLEIVRSGCGNEGAEAEVGGGEDITVEVGALEAHVAMPAAVCKKCGKPYDHKGKQA